MDLSIHQNLKYKHQRSHLAPLKTQIPSRAAQPSPQHRTQILPRACSPGFGVYLAPLRVGFGWIWGSCGQGGLSWCGAAGRELRQCQPQPCAGPCSVKTPECSPELQHSPARVSCIILCLMQQPRNHSFLLQGISQELSFPKLSWICRSSRFFASFSSLFHHPPSVLCF